MIHILSNSCEARSSGDSYNETVLDSHETLSRFSTGTRRLLPLHTTRAERLYAKANPRNLTSHMTARSSICNLFGGTLRGEASYGPFQTPVRLLRGPSSRASSTQAIDLRLGVESSSEIRGALEGRKKRMRAAGCPVSSYDHLALPGS